MRSSKGGITVFLAVIFMSLLVFSGSLIDIARIQVAERKVESALSTSVRSVLADYDADLVGEFGIFGLDTGAGSGEMKDELLRYFKLNLTERHEGIRFISYDMQKCIVETEGLGNLANKDILKHQILEYMKYKAPVTFVENTAGDIIAGFKKAKLGQKMKFAEKEKAVREKALELEGKLGQLNDRISGIKKNVADLTEEKLQDLMDSLEDTAREYLPQSDSAYDAYAAVRQLSDDFLDEKDPADNRINREAGIEPDESTRYEHVDEDNEKTKAAIEQYMREIEPVAKEIASLRAQIDSLQSQVDRIQQAIASLRKRIAALEEREDPPEDRISAMLEQIDAYESQILPLQQQIQQKEQQINDKLEVLENKLSGIRLEEVRLNEDSRISTKKHPEKPEEEKSKFDKKAEEILDQLKELGKSIPSEWLITKAEFTEVRDEDDSKIEGMKQAAMSIRDSSTGNDCEMSYENVFGYMKKILEIIEGSTLDMRDKLYLIEYVMDKFTFLTSQTDRNRYFTKGEVEYILAGEDIPFDPYKSHQALVVTDVLTQVWFLRFAVDTIDSFAANNIPDPFARLAWALAEGAVQACTDMLAMLAGEAISICPSCTAVQLQYSDHLRFLLLIQDEDITIRRVQQLMQVNIKNYADAKSGGNRENFRLRNYNTAVRAKAEVPVNLWFLPVLSLDKLGFRHFSGRQYVVAREVYIGY